MSQASFDAYNAFLMEGAPDRFTKILCRYEHYKEVIDRPGDIVECGVFKGQGLLFWAKMIQIFNPLSQRRVIGFDTFGGVPESVTGALDRASSKSFKDYAGVPAQVMEKAAGFGLEARIEIVAGDATETIPAYAAARPGLRVALLNLDFDVYEPTLAALEALYDRVVPGGIVTLDEYAVHNWRESDALDTFRAARGLAGIELRSTPWAMSPTAWFRKPLS